MSVKDKKKPKVSIWSITFNHVDFIEKCLEGILMQETDFEYEVIIGDDASTDGTTEILLKYAALYPKIIKPIIHKKNLGVFENSICHVFPKLKGEYVAICEGDDYWTDPKKLQKQVEFLEENEEKYAACYHKAMVINGNGELIKENKWSSHRDHSKEDLLFSRGEMITNTVMFRNQIEDLSKMMKVVNIDTFLFHKIGEVGGGKFMPEIEPSCYRIHDGGVWSLKNKLHKVKSAIRTYEAISQSLKSKNKTDKDVENKVAKVLNNYMIQELRNKSMIGYIKGIKFVFFEPMIRMSFFFKLHLVSIYKLFINNP